MKELNYKKMLEEVNALVQTDFLFDLDTKSLNDNPTCTLEEIEEMRNTLLKIYGISHCTICSACQTKYLLPDKE